MPSPRPSEARYFYLVDKNSAYTEPVAIVKDDLHETSGVLKVQVAGKEDMFHLSPVPPAVPLPALPTTTFKALTDESDERNDGTKSPYLLKSAQPIAIRPGIHHMSSSSSLLIRPDSDIVCRSLPRGSQDIIMGSCSSSPVISSIHPAVRERRSDSVSSSFSLAQESALGLRIAGSRRTSLGSQGDSNDREEHQKRVVQLRDVLDTPFYTGPDADYGLKDKAATDLPHIPSRRHSPVSPALPSATPVYASSAAMHSPTQPTTPQQSRPTPLSRASDAAAASEKARIQHHSSATSPSSLATSNLHAVREKDAAHQTYQSSRPSYSRLQSSESIRLKTSPVVASGITRGFRVQEAQRV